MSKLFITTSRKPTVLTRKLVKALAGLLGAGTENRGKRSFSEVVERAERDGRTRILAIYEQKGNPHSLNFFEGEWLNPIVVIQNVVFPEHEARRLPQVGKVTAKGAEGETLEKLFALEPDLIWNLELFLEKERIVFFLDGKQVGPEIRIKALIHASNSEQE